MGKLMGKINGGLKDPNNLIGKLMIINNGYLKRQ